MWNRPEVRERTRTQMENPRRDNFAPFARRLNFLAFCMALALMLPLSKASAQASAPAGTGESEVQLTLPTEQGQSGPPITITLQDALTRARKLDPAFLGAISDSKSAKEDRLQARNAMLPTISATTQYLLALRETVWMPAEGLSPTTAFTFIVPGVFSTRTFLRAC